MKQLKLTLNAEIEKYKVAAKYFCHPVSLLYFKRKHSKVKK